MPNGDEAVVGVDDPKMEGEFAAVEVAPPPKIDPNVGGFPQSHEFVEQFTQNLEDSILLLLVHEALNEIVMRLKNSLFPEAGFPPNAEL